MKVSLWLVPVITCVSGVSRADAPPIEGRIALGVRASSTSDSHYDFVVDDSSSVRLAADGMIGLRFGRVVVGLHAGVATPLRFFSSPQFDSGEIVASTNSTIYPLDLGLGAQLDAGAGVWVSAWLGTTASFTHASSPAAHISAIDFTGDIPAASWSDQSLSLGYGAAVGYDIVRNEYGRFAAVLAVESQGIGPIPIRYNNGGTGNEGESLTCRSITLGVAYAH
jgi:hypothetical protein